MNNAREDLLKDVIDLNDIIAFEYDPGSDVISFSDNIDRYIPVPHTVSAFAENIEARGKIHSDDVKKAISFFTVPPEEGKVSGTS